jgi:hypothetical protein
VFYLAPECRSNRVFLASRLVQADAFVRGRPHPRGLPENVTDFTGKMSMDGLASSRLLSWSNSDSTWIESRHGCTASLSIELTFVINQIPLLRYQL